MVVKRKLYLTLAALASVLGLICAVFSLPVAHAENDGGIVADIVMPKTDTVYRYIDEPRSVTAGDTALYVTTYAGKAEVFTLGGAYTDTLTLGTDTVKTVIGGASLFALSSGKLLSADGAEVNCGEGEVIDASGFGNSVYALKSSEVVRMNVSDGAITGERVSAPLPLGDNAAAKLVAAAGDNAFVAVSTGRNSYLCDIYMVSGEKVSKVFSKAPMIDGMVSPTPDSLVALQSGELCRYELKNGMLLRVSGCNVRGVHSVSANSSAVYALTGEGAVIKYGLDLKSHDELLASASDKLGFYRRQSNISTRKSALIVSDFGNDRVVKLGDDGASSIDFEFIQPMAAVSDNLGNIYVAHNMDTVDVFSPSLEHADRLTLDGAVIADLRFDPLNTLYALTADGKIFARGASGDGFAPYGGDGRFDGICVAPDGHTLYAMMRTNKEIVRVTKKGSETLFKYSRDAVSFTVDIENSFYLLGTDGSVVKYFAEGDYAESDTLAPVIENVGDLVGADKIVISTVKNELLDYGDLLVSDPVRHCIRKINGKSLGVKVVDDNFVPPVLDNIAAPFSYESIVRTAVVDLEIYEKPMEMSPIYSVAKGRKVLVISYDTGVGAFARIFVDDPVTRRGVYGYVYKAQLSAPLAYSAPEAEKVRVYNDNTPLYKLPSRNAPKLNGYEKLDKDTALTLADFVRDYADDYSDSQRWYRVRLGSCEGYVAASDVSVNSFEPIFVRPQTNAVIISVNGSTGAPLYLLDDGQYVMSVDQPLETGTRVEVVDTFDASEKLTKIKYYDAEKGTLTGYVETVYLKYDGVGILPVIVAVLLLLTIVAIVITVIWRNIANKKKLTKA